MIRINGDIISLIKSYLTVIEITLITTISKKWHHNKAMCTCVTLDNSICGKCCSIVRYFCNINTCSIKSIKITAFDILSPQNINQFITKIIPQLKNINKLYLLDSHTMYDQPKHTHTMHTWRTETDRSSGCTIFIKRIENESMIHSYGTNITNVNCHDECSIDCIKNSKIELLLLDISESTTMAGFRYFTSMIGQTNLKYLISDLTGKSLTMVWQVW